ncbi:MAG: hypothetical protein U1G07_13245 [Verrucomicrobiota bacterium]
MKLSPVAMTKLAAVVTVALGLMGCEAPSTTAGEPMPPVYAAATMPQPDLVTVTNVIADAPAQPVGPADAELPDPPPVKAVEVSDVLKEVVKLAESGVGDEVILAYIQNSAVPFNPTPEEIVYLTDIGLSDAVITALVNHRRNPAPVAQAATNAAPVLPPAEVVTAPTAAAASEATYNPEPQVVYSSPPVVQYVTPAPTVEYDYFYTSLSPYGYWVDIFRTTGAAAAAGSKIANGWRPY